MTRRGKRRLAAALAMAAGAVAVLVGLTLSSPAVYERTAPIGAEPESIRAFDTHVVNGVANTLLDESGGTRLDLRITEAMANAKLAQAVADARSRGTPVPPALENLRIGFTPGAIVLATRLGSGAGSVVVSQAFGVSATADGRLALMPRGLRVGLVPVPGAAAQGLLGRAREQLDRLARRRGDDELVGLLASAFDAMSGRPVALAGRRAGIYLTEVSAETGSLTIHGRRMEPDIPR